MENNRDILHKSTHIDIPIYRHMPYNQSIASEQRRWAKSKSDEPPVPTYDVYEYQDILGG